MILALFRFTHFDKLLQKSQVFEAIVVLLFAWLFNVLFAWLFNVLFAWLFNVLFAWLFNVFSVQI